MRHPLLLSAIFFAWFFAAHGDKPVAVFMPHAVDFGIFSAKQASSTATKIIAPGFTLSDAGGHARTLREFRGRPVALFFFCGCPWCHQCAEAWSEFQRGGALQPAAGQPPPRTVVVFSGSAAEALAFERQTGLDPEQTTMLLDPDLHVTVDLYHAEPCPRVFVLDAGQAVRYTNNHTGDAARVAPALEIVSRALSALRAAEAITPLRSRPGFP